MTSIRGVWLLGFVTGATAVVPVAVAIGARAVSRAETRASNRATISCVENMRPSLDAMSRMLDDDRRELSECRMGKR